MVASTGVYVGFLTALVGLVALIRPLTSLGFTSRSQGAVVLACSVVLVGVIALLPVSETRAADPRSRLDEAAPAYHFHEVHVRRVDAKPAEVYRAVEGVTADEIRLYRVLTWVRRFGCDGSESILDPPAGVPLLEVASRSGFTVLAREPERELVLGTILAASEELDAPSPRSPGAFAALRAPGLVKAAINFRIEPDGWGGSVVSTETRVVAADAPARRRFAAYWRVIYPGSALIRRNWLRAVQRRAER